MSGPDGLRGTAARLFLWAVPIALLGVILLLSTGARAESMAKLGAISLPSGSLGHQGRSIREASVNLTGHGGVDVGDVYIADGGANKRVQEFSSTGEFVRAFGLSVGGAGVNVCTAAAGCNGGTSSSAAGGFENPQGVAVDQSTGNVYVSDSAHRIDVYSATGGFEGAFGWKVIEGSGGEELQFCTTATGCQAGPASAPANESAGALAGPEGSLAVDPTTGDLYVPDSENARIDEYRPILNSSNEVVGATFIRAIGWDVAPGAVDEEQEVRVMATGGKFILSFGSGAGSSTAEISATADATIVQAELNSLATVAAGGGSVSVSGGPGDASGTKPYVISFDGGPLAASDVEQLVATNAGDGNALSGGSPSGISVTTRADGHAATMGLEVCTTASGCKKGATGPGKFVISKANNFNSPGAIAVDTHGYIYTLNAKTSSRPNDCSASEPCGVLKFNPDGTLKETWGPTSGECQVNYESGAALSIEAFDIAVDPNPADHDDDVFVAKKTGSGTFRVYEFDEEGGKSNPEGEKCSVSPAETAPALSGNAPNLNNRTFAVGTGSRVYAGESSANGGEIFILGPLPPPGAKMLPVQPGNITATTARLEGEVTVPELGNPGEGAPTKYHFEYSSNGVDWTSIPVPDASAGETPGSQPETVAVRGLRPGTTYQARLVAFTASSTTSSPVSFTTNGAPPEITLTYAEEITQTDATLGAHINPQGVRTSYHFEWGATSNYGNSAPAFDRQLGSGYEAVIAREPIAGLNPHTVYHYRVVTTNNREETTDGPDQTFETLDSCGLPDGRCYELASPPDKGPLAAAGNTAVIRGTLQFQAAPERPAIAYNMAYGLPDSTSGGEVLYEAQRSSAGWASAQAVPPIKGPINSSELATASQPQGLSEDLGCGVYASTQSLVEGAPTRAPEAGHSLLYVKDASGRYTVVSDREPTVISSDPVPGEYRVVGMSEQPGDECGTVVFRSKFQYAGIPGAGYKRLYEWDHGVLRNVGVVPGPSGPVVAEAIPGSTSNPAKPVGGEQVPTNNYWRAVSRDGSRIVFTAKSELGGDHGQQAVFVRDHAAGTGDLAAGSATVTDLDASIGSFAVGQEVEGAGIPTSTTITAVDPGSLTLSQPAASDGEAVALDAFRTLDASQSQTATANDGPSRYEIASRDGAYVFFTARYGLASSAGGGSSTGAESCAVGVGQDANGGGCDLYRYSPADGTLLDLSADEEDAHGAGVAGVLGASEDGEDVYFAARGRLAEAQSLGEGAEGRTEAENLAAHTLNVFLWKGDDLGAKVSYVGLIPDGRVPLFVADSGPENPHSLGWTSRVTPDGRYLLFESDQDLTGYEGGGAFEGYLFDAASGSLTCISCRRDQRPSTVSEPPLISALSSFNPLHPALTLSDDGGVRAFFVSTDALASRATEGEANLYQWEHGQISFLGSSEPSSTREGLRFAGASADGSDVYFATVDRLTWEDTDGAMDVYDARVGGGFPEPVPSAPPCDAGAEGSCNGASASSPTQAVPATPSFTGPGNPKAETKTKKRHHKKRHHKKRHHKKRSPHRPGNADRRAAK